MKIDQSTGKEHQEIDLQLTEEKLTLDRRLSHLSLDKEHLQKNQHILKEEIDKKVSGLDDEKRALVEKRSVVKVS